MNIADLLFRALEESNWELVSEVYFLISGNKKEAPGSDDISQMFSRLISKQDFISNMIESLHDAIDAKPKKKKQEQEKEKEKPAIDNNFSVQSNKPSRKVSERRSENKFDSMHDAIAEAGREEGYDKINDNIKPRNTKRNAYKTKTVKCTECGNVSEVNPMFAREIYTCDRCLGRRSG